jgi:MFS family permease
MTTLAAPATDIDPRIRRRSIAVLAIAQSLGGIGIGASISVGALAAADVSGQDALSGLASTLFALGAAAAAIPLARIAIRFGRRPALASGSFIAALGALVALIAIVQSSFPLLLLGLGMTGFGMAVNLQSRFAATDLSSSRTRGRDLSLVVWSATIGSVAGPLLGESGQAFGESIGLPGLAGVFLFPLVAQSLATLAYLIALRPDPLLLARATALRVADAAAQDAAAHGSSAPPPVPAPARPARWRVAILSLAAAQAAMTGLMAMAPIHLQHHGHSLGLIGVALSLHVAGMFALSPVFGLLTDRFGAKAIVILGQSLLALAGILAVVDPNGGAVTMVSLTVLGVGWSVAMVSGSALLVASAPAGRAVRLQGRSDLIMNLAGAAAGLLAGVGLALIGYGGLGLVQLVPSALVIVAVLVWVRPAR